MRLRGSNRRPVGSSPMTAQKGSLPCSRAKASSRIQTTIHQKKYITSSLFQTQNGLVHIQNTSEFCGAAKNTQEASRRVQNRISRLSPARLLTYSRPHAQGRGRVRAQLPNWLGSAKSHSTVHPAGRKLGQVMPAAISTAVSPANKVKPQARLSILILSKTYPSMGLYLAHLTRHAAVLALEVVLPKSD
jgi:hypothetical protein